MPAQMPLDVLLPFLVGSILVTVIPGLAAGVSALLGAWLERTAGAVLIAFGLRVAVERR